MPSNALTRPPLPALPDLPVRSVLPSLCRALQSGRDVVLTAPPGSGKTTLAPLALLEAPGLAGKHILVLEPRRMAARAAAWRMAALRGEPVGGAVGFQVRLENRCGARTRVRVLTEGILVRRLLADPELAGVGAIVFDEFHERSLQADLAFALCRDIQQGLRPDLRLVLMSATLDAEAAAEGLERPVRLHAEGRLFPVETRWTPRPAHEPVALQTARICLQALAEQPGGVLAFLPGEGEIRQAARLLTTGATLPGDVGLHPLYAALPRAEQDAALQPAPPGRRKLVLATAIAESSLTIEGIGAVVDSGWMRVSRFSPATGMARLETLRVTRDRADQRRGRAGRLGPGLCYRLWNAAVEQQLAPAAQPEICDADLADTVLAVADWGLADPGALAWVTPPPAAAWQQAVTLLQALEALDDAGRITAYGRRLTRLPMHPRLAHMVTQAAACGQGEAACLLAALLAERIPSARRPEHRSSDLDRLLQTLWGPGDDRLSGPLRKRLLALAREWLRAAGGRAAQRQGPAPPAGPILAWAYPDRIARRRCRAGQTRYLLSGGRGARMHAADPLAEVEWLVVAELDDADADATIRLAAAIDAASVEARFADRVVVRDHLRWDRRHRCVEARTVEQLGAIPLRERPLQSADPDQVCRCLCEGLRLEGLSRLNWTPKACRLRARLELLHRVLPGEDWPDVSDAALSATLETWLGPRLQGMRRLDQAAAVDLQTALGDWLGPQRRRRLDLLAPTHVALLGGRRATLDYRLGESPVLAVRIQDAFGLRQTPRVVNGRVAVQVHLLSPARRPVQITHDLESFWQRGYAQARKDLRGRYPKHHWPETPP